MRILLTNFRLDLPTGTELYVRDLALKFLARGHSPIVYSPRLGRVAKELRNLTVPVVANLNTVGTAPDIIHGQHGDETVTALLRFPRTPAVYVCHDWFSTRDAPPCFPRILRYVAIDEPCRDRLICESGIPEESVRMLYTFVDLERFAPRAPLPVKPKRALVLCSHTTENAHLAALRVACERAGVSVDVFGLKIKKPTTSPEELMREYDIVFGKARTAVEAMAVGCATIVYWWRRLGPMVTANEVERLWPLNFGVRAMSPILEPEAFGKAVTEALSAYDATDATEVSRRVREKASADTAADQMIRLYQDVIAEFNCNGGYDMEAEARAATEYVRKLSLESQLEREAFFNSTPYRVATRLEKLPLAAKASRLLARAFIGRPPR